MNALNITVAAVKVAVLSSAVKTVVAVDRSVVTVVSAVK